MLVTSLEFAVRMLVIYMRRCGCNVGKYAPTYSCILVTVGGWDGWTGRDWELSASWDVLGWLVNLVCVVDDPYATSGWVTDVMWRS